MIVGVAVALLPVVLLAVLAALERRLIENEGGDRR